MEIYPNALKYLESGQYSGLGREYGQRAEKTSLSDQEINGVMKNGLDNWYRFGNHQLLRRGDGCW